MSELAGVKRVLRLDVAGREAIAALRAAGIDVLLLKGPVTAAWLYEGEARAYVDVDLLVAPADVASARVVLRGCGFVPVRSTPVGGEQELVRADGATIDLHGALKELGADAATAWSVLWSHREPFSFHGSDVDAVDVPARLVHLCTHAVTSGATKDKPRDDLRRGIEREPEQLWRAAVDVARELGALDAMAVALRIHGGAAGAALADALALSAVTDRYERVRALDDSGVLAMGRKLVRGDDAERRALVRGWLAPEPAQLERRLDRHDVPRWLRRLPATRPTLLLLFPVLVARAVRSVARGLLTRR